MFRSLQPDEHWCRYLHNHVDSITPDGKLRDPLGLLHEIEDLRIDENSSGKLQAVMGHYCLGGIQCAFYAAPLSELICHRGRITDCGYIDHLNLYWFRVDQKAGFREEHSNSTTGSSKVEYGGKADRKCGEDYSKDCSKNYSKDCKSILQWGSHNQHLSKNLEMYNELGEALHSAGYASWIEGSSWCIAYEGRVYLVHKVLPRKNLKIVETEDELSVKRTIDDCGSFLIEVRSLGGTSEYLSRLQLFREGVNTSKIETLDIAYPMSGVPTPRWELVHDAYPTKV